MNEPGGNFAASPSGLWHGGIHVSAEGAGPMLDLKYGVRCLADGEVIAYRLDRISPTSRIPASGGQPELNVPYSTSFALVRHTLEYPAGNRLSFFSLYMHLQGFADYECEPSQPRPGYWSTQVEVTSYAQDRPHPASQGQPSAPDRAGLRVRASKQHGTIRCTLPHGARATIGRRDGDWGQVSAVEGPSPYPPQDGRFVGPYEAVGGWIFMGSEPGDPVVREVMPDSAFDRVVIPPHPVKVGAGDLIGYLGPYWHTADPAQPNRIVHIEVFCDGTLPAYIEASRAAAEADYHNERPILRIDRSVKLYAGPSVRQEGANAPRTAIVQVYSQCVLDALPADCKGSVDDDPFNHGKGEPWWKITSADSRYADITGWVRNRQTPAGRVTRESPGHWSDFEMFTDSDANNPTLFGSADAWLDYVLDAGKPDLSDVGKLKPLATGVYRAMSPARNEKEAADELLSHGANRWLRFRASRLIPRHRSEWASEESYRELFAQLVTRSEPSPYHAAEIERISKLAWWDEVQGKVSQPFPSSPDVFHIHPIGLVGNFINAQSCNCINYDSIWVPHPAPAYKDSQIVSWSHYRLPIDTSPGRIAGNSRRGGDASKGAQTKVIDFLVQKGRQYHLNREDIAMVLAMTRHESGFNPDAAAGTTSASGLGQFVDQTAASYGINTNSQRFDAEQGADAMVRHYLENKRLATAGGATGRNVFVMTYAYHHDGPSLAYGGKAISESKVMPVFDLILNNICSNVAD
ncbi:transglycosylase SLT domain-containing protein [Paraburkholderia sp. BL10I2N1]|uniref:transglycosylase SLT domain-containing protein n=1 Tax=Paraburkholderia sp. BL10I2N1 TaxID=1938796 RepID=UPI00105FF1B0|nr:transglycosylase SLT domain-containing protein [Paraburkholderia sp. BL10I2N1]TDN69125.1 soluble lytic murein transglycosylase-like protein [Paraburkholderia sp. BL10I2N1]